jgi:hypothetical protein
MNFDDSALENPIVRDAIRALNARDRHGWLSLFANGATMTDDGSERNLVEWSDREFFEDSRASITVINHTEDEGRTLYAQLHSDRWGDFETYMKFEIDDANRITRLDVGQV